MADFRGHVNGASAFSLGYVGVMTYVLAITGALDQPNGGDWFFYGLMAFGIGLVFGIWPDVDVNSKAQKFFYRIFLVLDVLLLVLRQFEVAAYLGLFAIIPALGKHRGWTHTWWAALVLPAPLVALPWFLPPNGLYTVAVGICFYGAAVTGYFSHLFLDGLLSPRPRRKPTGSPSAVAEDLQHIMQPPVSEKTFWKTFGSLSGMVFRALLYLIMAPFSRRS